MIAKDVYKSLRALTRNRDHKFENVFVHAWEADCFSVTSSNYTCEIEVKVSRSDFLADFNKPKHGLFRGYKCGYGILREGESWIRHSSLSVARHSDLLNYEIRYTNIKPLKLGYSNCPNKFFFACPKDLIKKQEVPEYAGLIYCFDEYPYFKIIKHAPFLHKVEFNVKEMLFSKYYWMSFELKKKIHQLEWRIKDLEEKQTHDTESIH
jgi:hypothetical protein